MGGSRERVDTEKNAHPGTAAAAGRGHRHLNPDLPAAVGVPAARGLLLSPGGHSPSCQGIRLQPGGSGVLGRRPARAHRPSRLPGGADARPAGAVRGRGPFAGRAAAKSRPLQRHDAHPGPLHSGKPARGRLSCAPGPVTDLCPLSAGNRGRGRRGVCSHCRRRGNRTVGGLFRPQQFARQGGSRGYLGVDVGV